MRLLDPGGSASYWGEGVCFAVVLSASGQCRVGYRRVPTTILASANLLTITVYAKQSVTRGAYGIGALYLNGAGFRWKNSTIPL